MFEIGDLRCENRREPLILAEEHPVFSWKIATEERDWFQKFYRIRVREEDGRTVWDSGRVLSGQQNQIEYRGEALRPDTRYLWEIAVESASGDRACASDYFETGLSEPSDWRAAWIGEDQEKIYHQYRRAFCLDAPVRRAKLYLCALGHGECRINGKSVTDAVLEPGWTDYRKTIFYTAYDVTSLLQCGENAVSVLTGDGMYSVRGGRYVYYPRTYGKRKLIASLRILLADGRSVEIPSDERWEEGPSPILFSCIYGGEDADGRISRTEPSIPGQGTAQPGWRPARIVPAPEGRLTAQEIPPVRVIRRYESVGIRPFGENAVIVDFGKNFSGRPCLHIRTDGTMAGARIRMVPGEILRPDGDVDTDLWHGNFSWNYTCGSEAEQEWTPSFSYTGFRYLRVEGADFSEMTQETVQSAAGEHSPAAVPAGKRPQISTLFGEFLSLDLEETGSFTSSDPLWNQIHGLIRQAMRSNAQSYLTDCPTREKFPWLEQTHLIGPALMKNWDLANLYEKIAQDCADSQHPDGLVPDICPEYGTGFEQWHEGFLDSPEWGSAWILNAWHLYRTDGNTRVLRKFYPAMKRYAEYLAEKSFHGILHHGLGDWLDVGPTPPYSQNTPRAVTATCIYAQDLAVLQEAAKLCALPEDTALWKSRLEETKESFRTLFLDPQSGWIADGSQTAQAMALICGLVPPEAEKQVIRHLRESVEARDGAVTAGDVGHPYLVVALHRFGMDDLLAQMADVTDKPGYGYQVRCGATSLTEAWDGPDPDHPHGSQNHLMLGSLDEWFYTGPGGLPSVRDQNLTGEIVIRPYFAPQLDFCQAEETFPAGRVITAWKRQEDGSVRLSVRIPPNLSARIPDETGKPVHRVGSGTYEIQIPAEAAREGTGR